MPDFVATLFAALALCIGLIALNALTRLMTPLWPIAVDENGLLQIGGAIAIACLARRQAIRLRPKPVVIRSKT